MISFDPTLIAEVMDVQFTGSEEYKWCVQKELAASFFRVRLWMQKELLEQLFAHYMRT